LLYDCTMYYGMSGALHRFPNTSRLYHRKKKKPQDGFATTGSNRGRSIPASMCLSPGWGVVLKQDAISRPGPSRKGTRRKTLRLDKEPTPPPYVLCTYIVCTSCAQKGDPCPYRTPCVYAKVHASRAPHRGAPSQAPIVWGRGRGWAPSRNHLWSCRSTSRAR